MIKLFPLLVDSTISQNIIPGVCKILEKYLIVNHLNDISQGISFDPGDKAKTFLLNRLDNYPGLKSAFESDSSEVYGRLIREADDDDDEEDKDFKFKSLELQKQKNAREIEKAGREVQKSKREAEKEKRDIVKDRRETGTIKIDTHEIKSTLSLEPTYVTYEDRSGTHFLGVKVFPYMVTNPQAYIQQLMNDKGLTTFNRIITSTANNIIRAFRQIMRSSLKRPLRWFGITFPEINGDPFDDIVLAKSKFGTNTMLLLNYANIKDDDVFMDSGGLDKLFALGWSSVLIADEVAKKLIFCMKEFYGHCSFIPYSFIYHTMGKDAMGAYENLEAAKKSMSPFQQSKVDASKFFGESLVSDTVKKYSGLNLPCLKEDCK